MTDERLTIRVLEARDATPYWELRLRGYRDEPENFGRTESEERVRPLSFVEALLSRKDGSFTLGAFLGDTLVGSVTLDRFEPAKRSHRATLRAMHVAREARGRGVGRALLQALLARAGTVEGLEQVVLTVIAANENAIGLYRSAGFTEFGREPNALKYAGRSFDELHLLRPLRP